MADMDSPVNVFGEKIEGCSDRPKTGFFRDGCCNTSAEDIGSHTVCAVMTDGVALRRVYVNDGGDIAALRERGFTKQLGLRPSFANGEPAKPFRQVLPYST